MSDGTDTASEDITDRGLSKKAIAFEIVRVSYAVGIGTVLTTLSVVAVYIFGIELPRVAVFTLFLIGFGLLPAGLYSYDRHHDRDLVIADLGLAIVRPAGIRYRILRSP
jgi:hypothetical protein